MQHPHNEMISLAGAATPVGGPGTRVSSGPQLNVCIACV